MPAQTPAPAPTAAPAPSVPTQKPAAQATPAGAPSVTGKVVFNGDAPEPAQIDMAAVKECAMQHPDGAFDESLVVNDGKLANVIVSIKEAPAGGAVPKEAAVLDQKGCQYKPHVLAVMIGQPIKVRSCVSHSAGRRTATRSDAGDARQRPPACGCARRASRGSARRARWRSSRP